MTARPSDFEVDDNTRVDLILKAVTAALDETSTADPDAYILDDAVVHHTLSVSTRRVWFAALLESVQAITAARAVIAAGSRPKFMHRRLGRVLHERKTLRAVDSLDEALDRGELAVGVLLRGEPTVDWSSVPTVRGTLLFSTLVSAA